MTEAILRIRRERTGRSTTAGRAKPDGEQLQLSPDPSPGPRRFTRRWSAAGTILLCSILAVLFVANAIRVDELLTSITEIEERRDNARRANEAHRAELTRLMSVEEVVSRAGKLGLVEPAEPPIPVGSVDRQMQ